MKYFQFGNEDRSQESTPAYLNNPYVKWMAEQKEKQQELDALKQKLAQTEVYTRKSDEELRQAAEDEFTSYYNQLRLSQQQAQQRQDLALANQAAGLQSIYDKQRNQVMETTAKNYTAAGNALLKRGMQRSSYGLQTLAGVNRQGAKDLQDVNDQQSAKEGEIASQRAQLEQQLAETLAQYDADMAKEMTGYTKANVLAQAAQSMLAQANQNSSAVLRLLQ